MHEEERCTERTAVSTLFHPLAFVNRPVLHTGNLGNSSLIVRVRKVEARPEKAVDGGEVRMKPCAPAKNASIPKRDD
jgi:hypothetical protein